MQSKTSIHQHVLIRLPSHLWILFFTIFISNSPNSCRAFVPQSNPAFVPPSKVQLKSAVDSLPFAPQSKEELESAVHDYAQLSPKGDCSDCPHGPIGEWDVSKVTDMSWLFMNAQRFNGDISKWDMSSVTDMHGMFIDAVAFNGDISQWDVSSAVNIMGMFGNAEAFNGDISKWDVARAKDMSSMFKGAKAFNGDISNWDVSSVTDMEGMFHNAALFNSDLSKWDVSSVKNMHNLLRTAKAFNGDISEWDVSRVTNMKGTFVDANLFNGDLSKWEVSSVTDMSEMLKNAPVFNADLSKWDVSSVTDMSHMFIAATAFDGDISKWDVSKVTDMNAMFHAAKVFNGDISKWDVSSVKNMEELFWGATSFKGDLSKWDVSRVESMRSMFKRSSFKGDLSKWDVSSVTDMDSMFVDAFLFKQTLCGATWVYSKASKHLMFEGSPGSISRTECTSATTLATTQFVARRPLPDRELIVRTQITTPTCPKCGTFKKSDRASCCAPGGAWFKNCGRAGNRNVGHRWFEGLEACKRIKSPADKTTTISSVCPRCGVVGKSGKLSCCGRGGSWFRNCGSAGNAKLDRTWYEGIQACKTQSQSKASIGHQSHAGQEQGIASFDGAVTKVKTVRTAAKKITLAPANTPTPMSDTPQIITPATRSAAYDTGTASAPNTARRYAKRYNIAACICLVIIIVTLY